MIKLTFYTYYYSFVSVLVVFVVNLRSLYTVRVFHNSSYCVCLFFYSLNAIKALHTGHVTNVPLGVLIL